MCTFVPQERLGRILRPSEHCLWLPQRGWGRAAGAKRETEALPFRDQLGWMRGKKNLVGCGGGGLLAGAELLHLLHFGIHCFCHCIPYTDPIIARRVITCKDVLFIIKNWKHGLVVLTTSHGQNSRWFFYASLTHAAGHAQWPELILPVNLMELFKIVPFIIHNSIKLKICKFG